MSKVADNVLKRFKEIGARASIREDRRQFTIDINNDKSGEFFVIDVDEETNMLILNTDQNNRHLVMMTYNEDKHGNKLDVHRFLCGHDERQWFVAAIPEDKRVTTVAQAKDALKPSAVKRAEGNGTDIKRQGEWFFIPCPNYEVDEKLVLKKEPLSRGAGSKPHIVDEIYRCGGTTVHVHPQLAPNGVDEARYKFMIENQDRFTATWGSWRTMIRDASVYARGRVYQPDPAKKRQEHKPLMLNFWHQVVMSDESQSNATGKAVTFLD